MTDAPVMPERAVFFITAFENATTDAARCTVAKEITRVARDAPDQAAMVYKRLFELAGKFENSKSRADFKGIAHKELFAIARKAEPAGGIPLLKEAFDRAVEFEKPEDRRAIRHNTTRELMDLARRDASQVATIKPLLAEMANQFEDPADQQMVKTAASRLVVPSGGGVSGMVANGAALGQPVSRAAVQRPSMM